MKMETESSFQNAVLNKSMMMDNVQKHNNCVNITLAQTFRSNNNSDLPLDTKYHLQLIYISK
jgi:hypothetical protein